MSGFSLHICLNWPRGVELSLVVEIGTVQIGTVKSALR